MNQPDSTRSFFGTDVDSEHGFTLIELVVAFGIFVVILGISIDLFLSFFDVQRRAYETQDVVDNGRFALERIAKSIRTSRVETSGAGKLGKLKLYHFRREANLTYELKNGKILEVEEPESGGGKIESYLTGNSIEIDNFGFYVTGYGVGKPQVYVTVIMSFHSQKEKSTGVINLQTTVTQRCYEESSVCRP